eukprot:1393198-Amorphochlora_amoeboformis.AAC.3
MDIYPGGSIRTRVCANITLIDGIVYFVVGYYDLVPYSILPVRFLKTTSGATYCGVPEDSEHSWDFFGNLKG